MVKNKCLFLPIIIGISFTTLTGCRNGLVSNSTEIDNVPNIENSTESSMTLTEIASSQESQSKTDEKAKQNESETGNKVAFMYKQVPQLPDTGRNLEDFVPDGWKILDSVELDFNEDGISDYVGVLETDLTEYQDYPRILFAIASDGIDNYHLDFQDINLIRTSKEGGVNGDPYFPLTAEGTSFTTHAYGGSAWRWSEEYTYTYSEGVWRLTLSEDTYGYWEYTTSYSKNDWESGVGIRKQRSSEFSDMEGNEDTTEYDIIYEIPLDEQPTLEQAGRRLGRAQYRETDWEVTDITFGPDVELSEDSVKLPNEIHVDYCDENCALYTFSDTDEESYYVAMYRWQDKVLSVLAKEDAVIDHLTCYKGKIYYVTEIMKNVTYKMIPGGKEQIAQQEETIGIRINRMEPDATGKEMLFEYCYPKAEQEIIEDKIPYLAALYEISGDKIILEVYVGEEPHPFYRMNVDGSEIEKIGQIPKDRAID